MQLIIGFFFILAFYFVGESISYLINHFIPGNIIGMLLLFFCLHFKLINPRRVKDTAEGLTKNMTLFFIPASVGLMEYTGLLTQYWASILIVTFVSTLIVLAVVGWIQQTMERRKSK